MANVGLYNNKITSALVKSHTTYNQMMCLQDTNGKHGGVTLIKRRANGKQ